MFEELPDVAPSDECVQAVIYAVVDGYGLFPVNGDSIPMFIGQECHKTGVRVKWLIGCQSGGWSAIARFDLEVTLRRWLRLATLQNGQPEYIDQQRLHEPTRFRVVHRY